MSKMALQETVAGTEAGKLQTELRDVFSKIRAVSRPNPEDAPVMRTTLFSAMLGVE